MGTVTGPAAPPAPAPRPRPTPPARRPRPAGPAHLSRPLESAPAEPVVDVGSPLARVELPVEEITERPARRARHLRPITVPVGSGTRPAVVATALVIAALFVVATFHAFIISGQLRLDDLQRQASAEQEELRRLRLEIARLESPERILEDARIRLGMVSPPEVGYLLPDGVPADDDELARVAAARAGAPVVAAPPAPRSTAAMKEQPPAAASAGIGGDRPEPAATAATSPTTAPATGSSPTTTRPTTSSTTATTAPPTAPTTAPPTDGGFDVGDG